MHTAEKINGSDGGGCCYVYALSECAEKIIEEVGKLGYPGKFLTQHTGVRVDEKRIEHGVAIKTLDFEEAKKCGLVKNADLYNSYIDGIINMINTDAIRACRRDDGKETRFS